jgi:hypothetical protein
VGLFLVFRPFVVVLVYMFSLGQGTAERTAAHQQRTQEQIAGYVRNVAATGDTTPTEQIAQAKELQVRRLTIGLRTATVATWSARCRLPRSRVSATAAARSLGRRRRGLWSVPPCLGTCSASGPGLLPPAPGDLAGRLLQLIHPLPGRREERRADEHETRQPHKPTDPDQHPSPCQEAAVDLNAPLGCVIAHHLGSFSPIGGRPNCGDDALTDSNPA